MSIVFLFEYRRNEIEKRFVDSQISGCLISAIYIRICMPWIKSDDGQNF